MKNEPLAMVPVQLEHSVLGRLFFWPEITIFTEIGRILVWGRVRGIFVILSANNSGFCPVIFVDENDGGEYVCIKYQ